MSDDKNIDAAQNTGQNTAAPVAAVERPKMKADQGWYSSIFTQLIVPLVATRYVWLALDEINPFNMLRKDEPQIDKDKSGIDRKKEKNGQTYRVTTGDKHASLDGKTWKEPSFGRYAAKNFAAFGMGTTFLGIIGKYSKNTLDDIKNIYAEAVGYELDKKPGDVTLEDVFIKSKNEAVKVTREAYITRTAGRLGTASTFFIPWHKFRSKAFKSIEPEYGVNANAGAGAIGVHLYAEGLLRKPSFFDFEQKLVGSKINRNGLDPYSAIHPEDIQTLLHLQRKHLDKNYNAPNVDSPEGRADMKLAARIAELCTETYDATPQTDSNFLSVGKLNYLIGFGLLEKSPESFAYVELAYKSPDMKAVKQVAASIKEGEKAQEAFARFGIDMNKLTAETPHKAVAGTENKLEKKFTDNIAPQSLTDFATKQQSANLGV